MARSFLRCPDLLLRVDERHGGAHGHCLAVHVVGLVAPRRCASSLRILLSYAGKPVDLSMFTLVIAPPTVMQSLKLPIDAVLARALDLGLRDVVGDDLLLAGDARAFEQRRRHVLRRRGRRRRRRRRRRSAHHAVEVTTDDTADDATLDATLFAVRVALVLDLL